MWKSILFTILLILITVPLFAAMLVLQPVDDPRVIGYKIYWGISDFSNNVDIHKNTSWQLPSELNKGSTYQFIATSYAMDGSESGPSNVVTYTVPVDNSKQLSIVVEPNGQVSLTLSFVPIKGYRVKDVLIDGVSVGPVDSYTFPNMSASHIVNVTFKTGIDIGPFKITWGPYRGTGKGHIILNELLALWPKGYVLTMIAESEEGSVFAGWHGVCEGSIALTCVIIVNSNLSITATFDLK